MSGATSSVASRTWERRRTSAAAGAPASDRSTGRPPYRLADDVFLCLADQRYVFLDLRRDQYFSLNRRNTDRVIALLSGSDTAVSETPEGRNVSGCGKTQRVVQTLVDKGIFVTTSKSGKAVEVTTVDTPESALLVESEDYKPIVRLGHWIMFLRASVKASWKLRFYSMQRTVKSLDRRKQRCNKSCPDEHDSLRQLLAIFHRLRPFYAKKYLCLFDSLALIEFLAYYRLYPQWVFGVVAEPFGAHCWVQNDQYILNDRPEYVRGYTPIMVV